MTEEIVCTYWNMEYNIGVYNGKYIHRNSENELIDCIREYHNGSIHYRIKGTSKRISAKRLNDKNYLIKNYQLQEYCPF